MPPPEKTPPKEPSALQLNINRRLAATRKRAPERLAPPAATPPAKK